MAQLEAFIGPLLKREVAASPLPPETCDALSARWASVLRLAFTGLVLILLSGAAASVASAQCLPQDSCCGNGICDPGDDIETCPEDCFRSCGRGGCEPDK